MKKTVKILGSEYLNCSCYGNPRKRIVWEDENGNVEFATTALNAMCGYLTYGKGARFDITYHYTRKGNAVVDYAEEVR